MDQRNGNAGRQLIATNRNILAAVMRFAPFRSKRSRAGRQAGIIIVAPPWPRSGSANLYAAQVHAYSRLGYAVYVLLGPFLKSQRRPDRGMATVSAMHFEGGFHTDCCIPSNSMAFFRSRSFFEWMLAGCDTLLDIEARYASAATIPASLFEFNSAFDVPIIHVNHVFEMRLARRLQNILQAANRQRPVIICDTHDVQSEAYSYRGKPNPFTGRIDKPEAILHSELQLLGSARHLVHCSMKDKEFFEARLPDLEHSFCPPSLDARTERALRSLGDPTSRFDFVFVGNNHLANYKAIVWLLESVLPRLAESSLRVGIFGSVCDAVRRRKPGLFARYEELFHGEVENVSWVYENGNVVLIPSIDGTGSSVKLVECLCSGRPFVATPNALRGLSPEIRERFASFAFDDPQLYAEAMLRALRGPRTSPELLSLYAQRFSSARFESVKTILGRLAPELIASGNRHSANVA